MEVVSTCGRGANTVYTLKDGAKSVMIKGASNLPDGVMGRWRRRQSVISMRKLREKRNKPIKPSKSLTTNEQTPYQMDSSESSNNDSPQRAKSAKTNTPDTSRALCMTTCKVCRTRQINRFIIPCGHLVFCAKCLKEERESRNECPICHCVMSDYFGAFFIE